MDRLSSLPLPLRVALGAGVALMVFAVIYMTALKGDGMTTIGTYESESHAKAAQWRLSRVQGAGGANGIASTYREKNGQWELRVQGPVADEAKQQLGIQEDGLATQFSCPEAGALATSAAKRAAELCTKTREIEQMLANESTILQAYVILTPQESGGFGAAETAEASIQIVPAPGADVSNKGYEWAQLVAHTTPLLTTDSIYIRTREGETLYDPTSGGGGGSERCANASDNIHDLTRCVNHQVAQEIEMYVVDIVQDSGKVAVSAWVTLSASAKQVTASDLTPVILDSRSSEQETSSGGSRTVSRDKSADRTAATEVTSETTLPGMVEQVNVSVTLHGVDRSIERTVRDQISALLSADANVSVRNVATSEAGTGADAGAEADAAADAPTEPEAAAAGSGDGTVEMINTDQGTLLTLFGVVLVALVAVLAVLWRRSRKLQVERRIFEEEFRNDMTRFQSVASRNPDDLAREIESWLQGQTPQRRAEG